MLVLALPPKVKAEEAEAIFRRRLARVGPLGQLKTLLGRPPARRRLTSFELLFYPHWIVPYAVPTSGRTMRGTVAGTMAVDALGGEPSHLMASPDELTEIEVDDDSVLDAIEIDREIAVLKAREAVRWLLLNKPYMIDKQLIGKEGSFNLQLGEPRLIYYPFWVAYYETNKGVDLLVLEGIEGRPEGPGTEDSLSRFFSSRLSLQARAELRQSGGGNPPGWNPRDLPDHGEE